MIKNHNSMLVQVKVKPNSQIEGVWADGDDYTVHVKNSPVEGKANRAAIKLLAEHLNVPASRLKIVRGLRSRTKLIEVLCRSTDGRIVMRGLQ